MKFLLLLLLSANAQAALKVENGEILPFTNTKYALVEFIKDYSSLMNLNVTYPKDLFQTSETLHVQLTTKVTTAELKKIFYESLHNLGYTPLEDTNVLFLNRTRDIRYLPTKVFIDRSFPKDATYSTVIYRLRYPLSSDIARNLRPFLSRYGRVVDLSDAKTLVINDTGENVERLLQTIAGLDSEKAYESLLNYTPKPGPEEPSPLKEKIIDLEMDKKLLEKKIIELKGSSNEGIN